MKMLLSSDGDFLFRAGYDLLGIPKDKIFVGYIVTASKVASSDEHVNVHKKRMMENGIKYEEIDIENKSEKEIKEFFRNKNIIHMEGGHTFYLLRAIKKTGFDKILKELLKNGIIYIGTSAGSSIMGPTIGFSSHIPDNASAEDLQALNYIPFLFKAHYTDDKRENYMAKMRTINYPVRFFKDGQGMLIEDGKYTFVGEGKEVKL